MPEATSLFVEEEDDNMTFKAEDEIMMDNDQIQLDDEVEMDLDGENDDDDDEVVQEIPLHMCGNDLNLHLFQYVNRANALNGRKAMKPVLAEARYQKMSSVWELDVPLDDTTFFNKSKINRDWEGTTYQTLRGVGVDNEGQYAGFMDDGQMYLIPVKKIAQLRPLFKYIDEASSAKKQDDAKNNTSAASQKAHVVTMSVKSVNNQSQNRLTGSLKAHKIADEEKFLNLNIMSSNFDEFKQEIIKEASSHYLKPKKDDGDYLDHLA